METKELSEKERVQKVNDYYLNKEKLDSIYLDIKVGDKIVLTTSRYIDDGIMRGMVGTVVSNCIPLFGAVLAKFDGFKYKDERVYEIATEHFEKLKEDSGVKNVNDGLRECYERNKRIFYATISKKRRFNNNKNTSGLVPLMPKDNIDPTGCFNKKGKMCYVRKKY